MKRLFKLEIYVPITHAHAVRVAIGNAGAGSFGNYTHCSFSTGGKGRFKGNENANPAIGIINNHETVEEEKIETQVWEDILPSVLQAMKKAHPYEEIVFQLIELTNPDYLLK